MLYSRIDLHKRTLAIHPVDAADTLVGTADLPTRREVSQRHQLREGETDTVDAATTAQLLRVQLIPEARMIRKGVRAVRDLLRPDGSPHRTAVSDGVVAGGRRCLVACSYA